MTSTGNAPLQVVIDEVSALSKFAADLADQMRAGSSSLDREVQSLFGVWKGSAADSYRSGWDEMQDGATKVWNTLTDIASTLDSNAGAFHAQETSTASSITATQAS
ncbi:WXG100 family type VII secretion target [Mycobacterium sp. D16R24]|uniref:WXG100 family type VII secretion target n=1 Tax=Mycobacterium sp. D16R24 TaxID=1855656 RepID=UPI0009942C45|nr:WXG100 family type VII secretion target [Mycobacterium sp. D16R24]